MPDIIMSGVATYLCSYLVSRFQMSPGHQAALMTSQRPWAQALGGAARGIPQQHPRAHPGGSPDSRPLQQHPRLEGEPPREGPTYQPASQQDQRPPHQPALITAPSPAPARAAVPSSGGELTNVALALRFGVSVSASLQPLFCDDVVVNSYTHKNHVVKALAKFTLSVFVSRVFHNGPQSHILFPAPPSVAVRT